MNRRGFLRALIPGAIALTDPEELIWRPIKTIFIPPARGLAFHMDALAAIDLAQPESDRTGIILNGAAYEVGDILTFGSHPQQYRVVGKSQCGLQIVAVLPLAEWNGSGVLGNRNLLLFREAEDSIRRFDLTKGDL